MAEQTIWITGASSGIGEALAIEWAKSGVQLILSSRNTDKLNKVKKACEAKGAVCELVPLDLTDEESIAKAAGIIKEKYKTVNILVNNGGISMRSEVIETPIEVDRKVMETNFFGAVNVTKSILGCMVENGGGQIVVISSIVGKFGFPLRSAYSASKHALEGFFQSLRAELSDKGIKVIMVSPGRIQTNISYNAILKDGSAHGQLDPGQANGMPVDVCARKIVKAVRKNKKDILVGNKEIIMVYIRKFLPSLYYKMTGKISAK